MRPSYQLPNLVGSIRITGYLETRSGRDFVHICGAVKTALARPDLGFYAEI